MLNLRQAVILGAGLGARLRGTLDDRPKGFLELRKKPIIEESIAKLIHTGITDIVIVTGYRHEFYDQLSERYPFVRTVFNPDFASSGSMLSLYSASQYINSDFLLLESDLVYEYNALQTLQQSPFDSCILLSSKTGSGDEVYVGVSNDRIVNMSKHRDDIKSLGGELVGISKISLELYWRMIDLFSEKHMDNRSYHYEDCLTDVSDSIAIHYHCLKDLAWIEIDDKNHLSKACEIIYPQILKRDSETAISKKIERLILLNPGPATTTDTVKYAMVVNDICPREKEFGDLVEGIRRDLAKIVHGEDAYEAILFASSGTGAVEACLSSTIPHDKSVLIISNGAYGKRMQKICDGYGISHIDYNIDWGKPIDCSRIETLIEQHKPKISHIAIVHHETTVGILNDIAPVGYIADRFGVEVIVDAMSSYAGIPIDVKHLGIHYLISSANKCIQGMAGLSFVICKKESLEKTKEIKPRNFYFNLYQNYSFFTQKHEMQFTPPVQILYALRQAINEYFLETERGREKRYAEMYEVLKDGLQILGFHFLVEEEFRSKILTAIIEPDDENYCFTEMHDFLFLRGFTIYPGKGATRKTFRIANMGAITKYDIKRFLGYLEEFIVVKGIVLRSSNEDEE